MKSYTIDFILFGKGMRVTVDATSPENAKEYIRSRIQFKKVIGNAPEPDPTVDRLMNMFKMKR